MHVVGVAVRKVHLPVTRKPRDRSARPGGVVRRVVARWARNGVIWKTDTDRLLIRPGAAVQAYFTHKLPNIGVEAGSDLTHFARLRRHMRSGGSNT